MAIFTVLYGNYYPPHGEFELICIGKFARRTWVNFTQQYGKNRQRCQQNKFTMLYDSYCFIFIENFRQKFSPCGVRGSLVTMITLDDKKQALFFYTERGNFFSLSVCRIDWLYGHIQHARGNSNESHWWRAADDAVKLFSTQFANRCTLSRSSIEFHDFTNLFIRNREPC